MENRSWTWRRLFRRVLLGLAIPLLLPALGISADLPKVLSKNLAADAKPATKTPTTLTECVQLALSKQPALAAHRASVASAESGRAALHNMRVTGLFSREIPIRKKQADLGLTIATAGANQAEWETVYAVTRTYFTVLFALEQKRVAQDVIGDLKATQAAAKSAFDAGSRRDVTQNTLDQIATYVLLAEARLMEAEQGVERALAALREAIGVDAAHPLQIVSTGLPIPQLNLTKEKALDLGLARRGEMAQAVSVAEVICLEVQAQGVSYMPTFRTFAAMVDIHARPIPQGTWNGNYRPDAIGIEMPNNLAGKRKDRMRRARDLHARADAVVEKTRNLISLEVLNTYFKWKEAAGKVPKTAAAVEKAVNLGKNMQKDFAGGQKVVVKDVLDALVLGVQTRLTHNETLYQHLLGLAGLQRVTAGGVNLNWENVKK